MEQGGERYENSREMGGNEEMERNRRDFETNGKKNQGVDKERGRLICMTMLPGPPIFPARGQ